MFSFGFQKAFERGLEAKDEVFFTRVGSLLRRAVSAETNVTRHFKEPGKCQGCRHGSRRFLGAHRLHAFRARWCVDLSLLYSLQLYLHSM